MYTLLHDEAIHQRQQLCVIYMLKSLFLAVTVHGHLLDSSVLGYTIDSDAIYSVILLLLVSLVVGRSHLVLSTRGQFYSKFYKLVAGDPRPGLLIIPELSTQQSRTERVTSVSLNKREIPNCTEDSLFRGDALPLSDSSEYSPKFYTSPPTSQNSCDPDHIKSPTPRDPGTQCEDPGVNKVCVKERKRR